MRRSIINKIYLSSTIKRIESKVKLLGNNNKIGIEEFLNVRLILTIIIFGIGLISFKYGYKYCH